MSIFFLIIKIILIILAVIAAIVAFALISPVTYKADVKYHSKAKAKVKVAWLAGILRVIVNYDQGLDPIIKVKALFFTIFDSTKKKKKKKRKKKRRKNRGRYKPGSVSIKEEESQVYEITGEDDKDFFERDEEAVKEDEDNKENSNKSFSQKIRGKLVAILDKISSIFKKIKAKAEPIFTWLDEDHRRLIAFLCDNGLKLFKKVRPKKIEVNGRFGTGDPYTTGRIVSWASIVIGMIGFNGIYMEADFENKVIEVDAKVKGHFFVLPVILIALKIYKNKDFQKFILNKKTKEELDDKKLKAQKKAARKKTRAKAH